MNEVASCGSPNSDPLTYFTEVLCHPHVDQTWPAHTEISRMHETADLWRATLRSFVEQTY